MVPTAAGRTQRFETGSQREERSIRRYDSREMTKEGSWASNLSLPGLSLPAQPRLLMRALWPHRVSAMLALALQLASVGVESIALVSLASLVSLLLDLADKQVFDSGVMSIPAQILSALNIPMSTGAVFVFILLLFGLKALLRTGAVFAENNVMTGFHQLRSDELAGAYLRADWKYLVGTRSGEVINVAMAQVWRGGQAVRALLGFAGNVLSSGLYLAVAVFVSPVGVGLFVGSFALMLLAVWPLLRRVRVLAAELVPAQAGFAQRLGELLSGAKVMKALGVEERVQADLRRDTAKIRRLAVRIGGLTEITSGTELAIITSLSVLFLLHTTGLAGAVNAGVIGVILLRVSQRAQSIVTSASQVASGVPSIAATLMMYDELHAHQEPSGSAVPGHSFGILRFDSVSYEYDPGRGVLRSLDFDVAQGEFVGVVGGSGAGKTTFVDLSLGLLNPTSGRIMVDATPLAEMDRIAWRQHLGYVPQDTILFNDSIYNNIAAYRPGVSDADVRWAVEIAQAREFIEHLEQGYDHVIGDRGATLSGGQRQRLALARALAGHPEILLLDEATSSLDSHAEHEFQQALENTRSGFTILAVAHRLSTVMRADRVIVLEEGRIVESGPPLELFGLPGGHFQRLHALQTAGPQSRARTRR